MAQRKPSELEHVVLGVVWKEGACTPHVVRTHFASSRNSRFSGSAGAIYPLVQRLERRGLLRSVEDRSTRQRRRLYRITARGETTLANWVGSELAEGVPHDPIRLRLYFLEVLSPTKRAEFLAAAANGVRHEIACLAADRARYAAAGWDYSVHATDGALAIAHAQLEWLASLSAARRSNARGKRTRRPEGRLVSRTQRPRSHLKTSK
ncbi:MAG: PadR family transcriptional regulator [Planctomycetes bacterium]|nr:PadR family transcriptional regulator [Planctomycetota bacterium]